MIYQWKEASRIKADAQKAGRVFETLERTIGVTPQNVLDASRPKSAPLHDEFEWNDSVAAEKYRVSQAGHLIRCLCVKTETREETPVRAFFKVKESSVYESIVTIKADPEKSSSLLELAKKELQAFKNKYKALQELTSVFDAIDTFCKGDESA